MLCEYNLQIQTILGKMLLGEESTTTAVIPRTLFTDIDSCQSLNDSETMDTVSPVLPVTLINVIWCCQSADDIETMDTVSPLIPGTYIKEIQTYQSVDNSGETIDINRPDTVTNYVHIG